MDFEKKSWQSYIKGTDTGELPLYVRISVENSVYTDNINSGIFASNSSLYTAWNNLSSNVVILKPGENAPIGANVYTVTYIGEAWNNVSQDAVMIVISSMNSSGSLPLDKENHETTYNSNTEWEGANIYVNTSSDLPGLGDNEIVEVLIHELGHALLLQHSHEETLSLGLIEGYCLLSIMDPSASNDWRTCSPTFWDKVQFILKWGV